MIILEVSEVSSNDLVLYHSFIRSKSYQNHNLLFYKTKFNIEDFKENVKKNKVTKLVLGNESYRDLEEITKNCKYIKKKKFNLKNTRNPFIKKSMGYVYLIDTRCIL